MDLSVLIVSYNTRAKTLACLRSVARETRGLEYEVRVLDNASCDGSAAAIRAEFPDLPLDASGENLGFARGINRLARAARGGFLLLLNPDTEVRNGAVQELVAFARSKPAPGIYGGRTVHPDGSPDPGFAWGRATPWSTLCNAVGLAGLFPRSALLDPEGIGTRLGEGEHEVDIVSGCFFLVQRAVWEELGGFDPAFFVYGEEADFCLRARARGIRPRITSRAVILHHGGASETSLAAKQTKLLEAKHRLMRLHWPKGHACLGGWLLAQHAFMRACGFTLLSWARPRTFGERARNWRTVWARRRDWLGAARVDHTERAGEPAASSSGDSRAEPALSYSIPDSSRAAKVLRDGVACASGASAPDATNIAALLQGHPESGIPGPTAVINRLGCGLEPRASPPYS